jgi:hypothetical protein
MSAFIETTIYECDALVNVDAIEMARPDFDNGGDTSVIRWRRPYEQTSPEGGSALSIHALEYNEDEAQEPYDSLKAKILAATVKEKENIPPTPPIREKEDRSLSCRSHTTSRTRTREEACVPPTPEEAHAYAMEANLSFDVDAFWDYYEIRGWTICGFPVCNWKALMREWVRRQDRWRREEAKRDAREARRLAHIDAKMDEREAKRERRTGGGRRKADNNVEMSDEVREEVRRDFTF